MSKKIIYVDPHEIKKLSPVAGCASSRKRKANNLNYHWKNGFLYGNWDKTDRTLEESLTPKDFNLYNNKEKSVYSWDKLYHSMKERGYTQDTNVRYIEVALGRTGELLLVDGRHRLFLAQRFNIQSVPVEVLDIHPDYNFDNLSIIQNEVIPEFIYDLITDKWDKKIKVYHHHGTIGHRHMIVEDKLSLLKGKNVLEVGCNSGMMMWSIIKHANTLVELEHQDKYFKQAEIATTCLKSLHNNNVSTIMKSFENYIKDFGFTQNALYVSFVLYHMNDVEIKILKENVLPKCDVVIVPNRNKERGKQKNSYRLNRPECIQKLLEEARFIVDIIYPDKGYSVITGTRKCT